MTKTIFFHDDPPCNADLDASGVCPKCAIIPDMQSKGVRYEKQIQDKASIKQYGSFPKRIKDMPNAPFWIIFRDGSSWTPGYGKHDAGGTTSPELEMEFFTDAEKVKHECARRTSNKESFRCFKITSEATIEVHINVDPNG